MRPFPFQSRVVAAILLLALFITVGGFWCACTRNNNIAFLPAQHGAEWIVYPKPASAYVNHAVRTRAVFQHTFVLGKRPASATLTVRAFKSAVVLINGQAPGDLRLAGGNWKSTSTANVTGVLRAGTNDTTVCVTNLFGPPALWLRLQTDQLSQGTDERWQVSSRDGEWLEARRATQPPIIQPGNPLYGGEATLDSAKRARPVIAVFCAISFALVWVVGRW